jgi:site-specific DNA recombinase
MDQRPGLKEALQKACEQKATLVVYSLSRLARSTRDTLQISDRLAKAGAELVSLSEKIDTTSAAGKMVFRMLAVLAEFERDQISERTKTAMTHLRRNGRRISRYAPYGWDFDSSGSHLLPNAIEQAVVTRVRAMRAAQTSYREIARVLDGEGVPTKNSSAGWSSKVVRDLVLRTAA